MRLIRLCLLLVLVVLSATQPAQVATAQDKAQLSLQSGTTSLKTGEKYPITVQIKGGSEVWLASFELKYDPNLLYIIGTKAGSPIKAGEFFKPAENVLPIFNRVDRDKIVYTISMLAPGNPVSGDGVIGTFMIYPIAPGKTEIRFNKAELYKENFATDEAGQRIGVSTDSLPIVAVLLQLDITGDKVEPPSEATATPIPTETFTPTAGVVGATARPGEPTLENVTAAPTTPTPAPTLGTVELPPPTDTSGPLLLSLGLVGISVLGLLIVVALWMRSRRRG